MGSARLLRDAGSDQNARPVVPFQRFLKAILGIKKQTGKEGRKKSGKKTGFESLPVPIEGDFLIRSFISEPHKDGKKKKGENPGQDRLIILEPLGNNKACRLLPEKRHFGIERSHAAQSFDTHENLTTPEALKKPPPQNRLCSFSRLSPFNFKSLLKLKASIEQKPKPSGRETEPPVRGAAPEPDRESSARPLCRCNGSRCESERSSRNGCCRVRG